MAHPQSPAVPEDDRKKNLRLGLILASVAIVFFVGFIAKTLLLGK